MPIHTNTPTGRSRVPAPLAPVSSLIHIPHQLARKQADALPVHSFSSPAALAVRADRAPLLLHSVKPSAIGLRGESKITTEQFADVQKVFDGSSNVQ